MRVGVAVGIGLSSLVVACSQGDGSGVGAPSSAGKTGGGVGGAAGTTGNAAAGAGASAAGRGGSGNGANGGGGGARSGAGGNGAGGTGAGRAGAAGAGGSAQEGSEYADLYRVADSVCRTGKVDVELNLTGVTLNGIGFLAQTFDDVVDGDTRRLRVANFGDAFVLELAWPAAASGGVEVEASGVLLSTSKPEVNVCFEGKAIVGKDVGGGELFHLVAARDVRAANADGTCTATALSGTVVACTPNEK